uniref:AlNc14C141G7265 protein n=1 Tax=Albugo laibachii Nc14 TaxID=890382 RepID=F0WL77_9STRA|nr:AlNc14C141G7265 [Albugo laibachii Nc14]|eukprot:CCA22038.1 AlNc14C141G7265 [Albugo laibachii Nc14]
MYLTAVLIEVEKGPRIVVPGIKDTVASRIRSVPHGMQQLTHSIIYCKLPYLMRVFLARSAEMRSITLAVRMRRAVVT